MSPCLLVFILGLTLAPSARGQESLKFVPSAKPQSGWVPAQYVQRFTSEPGQLVPISAQGTPRQPDDRMEGYTRTDLPGPQRLFLRESEAQFFDRIAQDMKKQSPTARAIFPETPVLSKERYSPRRYDSMPPVEVEPCYVCHRRLYFEQPNFERAGYNFGILQPAFGIGIFYYDLALLPYHSWSDLHDRGDCSAGKCLPGDPAPMLWPRERLSGTGLLGQAGAIIGLAFLFP